MKVCYAKGLTDDQKRFFHEGLEDATDTDFEFDDKTGCVDPNSIKARGHAGFGDAQRTFRGMVGSSDTYSLAFGSPGSGTFYDQHTRTVNMDPSDVGRLKYVASASFCNPFTNISVVASPGAYMAHELLGHGTDGWLRRNLPAAFGIREGNALSAQNRYHAARNQPERCGSTTYR